MNDDRKQLAALGSPTTVQEINKLPLLTILGKCEGKRGDSFIFRDCKIVTPKALAKRQSEGQGQGRQVNLALDIHEAQVQANLPPGHHDIHEAQPYEYKVVDFRFFNPAMHTTEINKLAADGWEYVGGLFVVPSGPMGASGEVLFRRPRK